MTIVIDVSKRIDKVIPLEIFSGIFLDRRKRFYLKQKDGTYMIPESEGGEL